MRDTLHLLELLLVKGDVIVPRNVLERPKQVIFHVLFSLLLLDNNCALNVQVILFLQDVIKWWVSATIDANLLELVAEVILDGLLFEAIALENDVILSFQDKAVDDKVLSLK